MLLQRSGPAHGGVFFARTLLRFPIKDFKKSRGAKDVGLTIWGRANSVNVQKVLWCLAELDIAYERIDAGMAFGRNN
jgi:hypothetical protein